MDKTNKTGMAAWIRTHAYDVAAYAGLLITVALFFVFSGSKLMYNLTSTLQTVAPFAIISLGAVFVYSMGYMDVSVGQQVGVYAILMILITNKIGNAAGILIAFAVVLVIAMICGAFNGAVAVWLGLPSIVTSLFLMFIFGGTQMLLMEKIGNASVKLAMKIRPDDRMVYTLLVVAVIILVVLITTYFFYYTKLGKYTRAIGANEQASVQSGINIIKWKILAYMYFGITIAIGSLVLLSKSNSAGKGTGNGYAMDIMVCLILGGMPLSGGTMSRVRSALIGTFTYTLLANDLTVMGVDLSVINLVKAIVFLAIVFMTCRKKNGTLPR